MRRAARFSPTVPCAIQGHVALNLRHRRAHMREQELRGVVLKGLATPQEDAKYDQRMAGLVRAQVHACVWKKTSRIGDVGATGARLMLDGLQDRSEVLCSTPARLS